MCMMIISVVFVRLAVVSCFRLPSFSPEDVCSEPVLRAVDSQAAQRDEHALGGPRDAMGHGPRPGRGPHRHHRHRHPALQEVRAHTAFHPSLKHPPLSQGGSHW